MVSEQTHSLTEKTVKVFASRTPYAAHISSERFAHDHLDLFLCRLIEASLRNELMGLASLLAARNGQPDSQSVRGTAEVVRKPSVRMARDRSEREGAFKVLYRTYLQADLAEPNSHGLRVTPYHLLPTTSMFVSELENEVVATVSLCEDGALGLPIESLYPEKIAELRSSGARLAEVCSLADRRRDPERGLEAMISLTKMAIQMAERQKIDYLLCVAHPRHGKFYKRATGMVAIDEVRACPYVKNRPAEPLLLDMNQLAAHPPRLYGKYFDQKIPDGELQPSPLSVDEVFHFAQYLTSDAERDAVLRGILQSA